MDGRSGLAYVGASGDTLSYRQFNQVHGHSLAIARVVADLFGGEGIYSGGAAVVGDLTTGNHYPAVTMVVLDDSGEAWFFRLPSDTDITFVDASGAGALYAVIQQLAGVSPVAATGGKTNLQFVAQLAASAAPAHSLKLGTGTITASAFTTYTPQAGVVVASTNLPGLGTILSADALLGPPTGGSHSDKDVFVDAAGSLWIYTSGPYAGWDQGPPGEWAGEPTGSDFNGGSILSGYLLYDSTAHAWKRYTGAAWVVVGSGDVTGPGSSTDGHLAVFDGSGGKTLKDGGAVPTAAAVLEAVIDGGGAAITTGVKGDLVVPFACTITSVTALANQTGSIVVDLWAEIYANYPPTDADSITASSPVTISSGVKAQDATLTGWTKALAAGDVIRYNVDSCTDIQRLTISLAVTKG